METNIEKNDWAKTKKKIKAKWSKFSDKDIDAFHEDLSKVSAQIVKTYGVARAQAEKEFKEFKSSM